MFEAGARTRNVHVHGRIPLEMTPALARLVYPVACWDHLQVRAMRAIQGTRTRFEGCSCFSAVRCDGTDHEFIAFARYAVLRYSAYHGTQSTGLQFSVSLLTPHGVKSGMSAGGREIHTYAS